MSENDFRFPEYGDGGDHIGSKRQRRAFRIFTATCMMLTAMLWFTEYFLRHDHTERLYLSALTLPDASARPLLRSAVKQDAENREFPTPKYLQALAAREEDDLILETYDKAHKLDPENPAIAIQYGVQLLRQGSATLARERFREAARNDDENALALYLEAAVTPWTDDEVTEDLVRKSLTLVAKANSSGKRVVVPRPLWFSGLPRQGTWYARQRREMVDTCCYPIQHYVSFLVRRADAEIAEGKDQYWDSWLENIESMGRHIAQGALHRFPQEPPPPGAAVQVLTGVRVQTEALSRRLSLHIAQGRDTAKLMTERLENLQMAEERLIEFEREREDFLATLDRAFLFPLRLISQSMAICLAVFAAAYAISRVLTSGKRSWTLSHPRIAYFFFAVEGSVFFFMLVLIMTFQQTARPASGWMTSLAILWWCLLGCMLVAGLAYPALLLPNPSKVTALRGEAERKILQIKARKAYRAAYLGYMRRFYGITLGVLVMSVCLYVITHRITINLYPWQVNLLSTPLGEREYEIASMLLGLLR
jgi:tetratricopeptide (TPR) repeat protein